MCYSKPQVSDRPGVDYQHAGHVNIDLLKQLLPSSNYDYYICGPGAMMTGMTEGLEAWGVHGNNIFFEAFGPASVKKKARANIAPSAGGNGEIQIAFDRSGTKCSWDPDLGSLLDTAEQEGIEVDAGCRAGSCGSCLVAIKSGRVENVSEPGIPVEDGSCLVCIARPVSDVVLDA